jgi:hypothetical protein
MKDTIYIATQTIQDYQNYNSGLTPKDWVGTIALFLSAIIAVLIGQYLQDRKIKTQAKEWLFRTLFSLRGQPVNHNYVNALNQIDIVFHKNKNVLDAWHKLYDSLNEVGISDRMKSDEVFRIAKNKEWDKLRHEIIFQMASVVGYDLKVMKPEHLLNPSYSPEGHAFAENFEWDLKAAAKEFFELSVDFHKKAIAQLEKSSLPPPSTKDESN